jgi:hypothetical protein
MSSQPSGDFCPSCGSRVSTTDKFCRACGRSLADDYSQRPARGNGAPADEPTGPTSPAPDEAGRRARWIVPTAIVVILLVVGGVALLTVGKSNSKASKYASQAKAERVAYVALRNRLYAPFTVAIGQRAKFLISEASFLTATRDANAKIKKYQAESQKVEAEDKQIQNANSGLESACRQPESSVPCPSTEYPEPPSAPSLQGDVAGLRRAVSDLSSLNAEVLAVTAQSELRPFYAQLQAAITALTTDAQDNANILSEGITEPQNGSHGYVEEKKLATIHPENGLYSVKLMNQQAVALIHILRLDISQYDVPGGTDANPADHSFSQ